MDEFDFDSDEIFSEDEFAHLMESTPDASEQLVNYHFPIEIVIVGTLTDDELEAIEQNIWTRLSESLSASA